METSAQVTKFESLRGKAFTQIPQAQLDTIRGGMVASELTGSGCMDVFSTGACGCLDCGSID